MRFRYKTMMPRKTERPFPNVDLMVFSNAQKRVAPIAATPKINPAMVDQPNWIAMMRSKNVTACQ